MTITNAQYLAWLANPNKERVVLIDAGVRVFGAGADSTRYISTKHYNTGPTDTPANQYYLPMAVASLSTNEQLSIKPGGQPSMTIGNIEILNLDGSRDSWFNDIWVNRPIQAFYGDPSWPRTDFRMIFNGVIEAAGSSSRDKLNLKIRDKSQRLNTAITETKLGGSTTNKDANLPRALGQVCNMTPLLTDPTTLEYQWTDVGTELAEVRDNGIPVTVTSTLATGKFKLAAAPAGAITISARGDTAANSTLVKLVQRLVTNYGKPSDKFSAATDVDLDTTQLASFNSTHLQELGMPLTDRGNLLQTCEALAASLGAQPIMSRTGLLRILQVDLASLASTFDIKPAQMVDRNLWIRELTDVAAAVKVGFNKIWTVQPGLQTTIPAAHKEMFDTEWRTSTQIDTTVQALYKLTADPIQEDTMLLKRTDADAEATRRLNLRKVQRAVYEFEGTAEMFQLELGQGVTLYHPRFGLAAGKVGMVVSLNLKWSNGRVTVGVFA